MRHNNKDFVCLKVVCMEDLFPLTVIYHVQCSIILSSMYYKCVFIWVWLRNLRSKYNIENMICFSLGWFQIDLVDLDMNGWGYVWIPSIIGLGKQRNITWYLGLLLSVGKAVSGRGLSTPKEAQPNPASTQSILSQFVIGRMMMDPIRYW